MEQENRKFDALYINGRIFTSDTDRPYAYAMAVKDGRIAWVGDRKELEALGQPESLADVVVDFGAKRVVPGFVDSHMHAINLANVYKGIIVLPPLIHSIEELQAAIREKRAAQGAGEWIEGRGYDEGKLAEHRAPTRHDLDAACSDAPVWIERTCGHMCVVNSYALELAGVTKDTPDPVGGHIGRDARGELTGILYENAEFLVKDFMPLQTIDSLVENVCDLGDILVSQGVTTASDLGESLQDAYPDLYHDVFERAIERGFPVRIGAYCTWDHVRERALAGEFSITEADMDPARQIRIAGIKLLADGSVSGRTAWTDRPYLPLGDAQAASPSQGADAARDRIATPCDAAMCGAADAAADGPAGAPAGQAPDAAADCGIKVCTDEAFAEALAFCKAHRCQLSLHAMGARAIDWGLDQVEGESPWLSPEMLAGGVPSYRMEHVAMPTAQAIRRAAAAGIYWVTQPIFQYAEIESYLTNLGPDWTKETYPIADWRAAGVPLAFSTDSPATAWATPSDPFVCLKAAVTRRAYDGTDCGQAHRVDIETAVRLYTAAGAQALGFTHVGKLQAGYAADFLVLDRDLLSIPPAEIDRVRVDETYIGGRRVYTREDA